MTSRTQKFDLWQDFGQLQNEMTRLFSRNLGEVFQRPAIFPLVNVRYNDDEVVLTAEVPGLEPEDLDITVTRDQVTLKGTRQADELQDGESFFRQERPKTEFERTVKWPVEVDPQSHDAKLANGILTLRLPRPSELKPQKISIQAG
ncbi:Hsp20/alpha crystallin family protein [Thalassoroseus pseudoceratinae]|uniref:Hsp20/alpha crystallin family protein n=1 Tax=Thalassoroseus pseudoceratinae TaxID=2713176 RepID=UPI00142229A3|nr:Hsp20/alpha crystallin family protein [Thalassoroseus pseudoceratinae]